MCGQLFHAHISYHIMKITTRFFSSVAALLFASVLIGCSGNDSVDGINNEDSLAPNGISFSLTETDFNEEVSMGSRSSANLKLSNDTTDLGDGVLAEMSMIRERGNRVTRAGSRPISNGHYTVLAYDATGALKGQINATVVSGKFSTSDVMTLDPGTYTFICLNDKVDFAGGVISVKQANAETARIGRTVKSVSGVRDRVPFEMNHAGLRVRVSLEAMVNIPSNVRAMIFDNSGTASTVANYDPLTGTYSAGTVGNFTGAVELFRSTGTTDFTKVSYVSTPYPVKYQYILPTQTSNLKLKFTTADEIYHKNLAGLVMTPQQNVALEANGSYLLNVKLTKVFKYLFDDGTVDFLRNKGTRTPIALVISETDRSAIALKDANNGALTTWTANRRIYNNPVAEQPSQHDQIPETSLGYHYTWEASGSLDGTTIKANEPVKCPAFYHAAHYDPGVTLTGSNLSSWYLGSNTDLKNVYLYVGFGTNKRVNAASSILGWYYHVVNKAFEDAGGTTIANMDPNVRTKVYWSSTYYKDFNTGIAHIFNNSSTDGNHSLGDNDKAYVRAFIHY